jgi:predicted enzyme related to lactoylglutathione lyase
MISNSKVVAFAATKNSVNSRNFYENVLGLKILSDDMFAIVFDANGTMLRIQKVQEHNPPPFTALGWEVADINVEIDELVKKGVIFNKYEGLDQDKRNIWTVPGGAKVAWFSDPDGNTLSLTQFR